MILSDGDIHKYLDSGELVIIGSDPKYPFEASKQVQPCSIDLRLSNRILRFCNGIKKFDVKDIADVSALMEEEMVDDQEKIILRPNSILFSQIYEQLRLPSNCCGYIEGRSRFARLGLSVHVTGGFINPEFEGSMPLQIVNHNNFPVTIYPFMGICQMLLHSVSSMPVLPYPKRDDTPYHGELNAGPSFINQDPALENKRSNSDILNALNALKSSVELSDLREAESNEVLEVLNELEQAAKEQPKKRKRVVVKALLAQVRTFTKLDQKLLKTYNQWLAAIERFPDE